MTRLLSEHGWHWLGAAVAGALALAAFYAALPWIIQSIVRLLLWPWYQFRVRGLEHLPRTGPVLIAANHVTWLDGFFLAAVCPRRGRCLVNSAYLRLPIVRKLAERAGMIPVPASGPRGQREAIRAVRRALDFGEAVGVFPEAQLTRNGLLGRFYRGIEVMLDGREHVPVIPVYMDNLWCSLYSFSGGRFLLKRPRMLRRTVSVAFGPPVAVPVNVFALRLAILEAGVRAFERRPQPPRPLETLDLSLPHLDHPALGLLAASTADYHQGDVHQVGHKPGSAGQAVPGVALRVVGPDGTPLPPDQPGTLQALVANHSQWCETGCRARIDGDGFVWLEQVPAPF